MFSCKYWKISKNTYFEEHIFMAASEVILESDCFELSFWRFAFKTIHPYQSLSNQSLKHNLVLMHSLNLTPTRSFEPRFCIFIINGYDSKSKRL